MTSHHFSVLIVDDNEHVVDDYKTFLESKRVKVYTSPDGSDGIIQAKTHKPDAILLDLMLPHLNGIETLQSLKADGETKDIPIIVITALVEDQQKEISLNAGAIEYVCKTDVTPSELYKKLCHVTHQNAHP